jgi:flagellar protein FliO/FliZ
MKQTMKKKILLSLLPGIVAAAGNASGVRAEASGGGINNLDTPPDLSGGGSLAGSLVWVIVALLLVIGLIVLFIKILSARNRSWGINRTLRSLGGVTVGQNKSLQIVEFAGRLYIVGVGDEVTLLDKIEDPDTAASIIAMMEEQTSKSWSPATVSDLWNKFRNRGKATESEQEPWNSNAFQEMLDENLQRQADHKKQVKTLLNESNQRDRLGDE